MPAPGQSNTPPTCITKICIEMFHKPLQYDSGTRKKQLNLGCRRPVQVILPKQATFISFMKYWCESRFISDLRGACVLYRQKNKGRIAAACEYTVSCPETLSLMSYPLYSQGQTCRRLHDDLQPSNYSVVHAMMLVTVMWWWCDGACEYIDDGTEGGEDGVGWIIDWLTGLMTHWLATWFVDHWLGDVGRSQTGT